MQGQPGTVMMDQPTGMQNNNNYGNDSRIDSQERSGSAFDN